MDATVLPPVGQLLGGRYHVGSCIARGGMATVYVATDTRLDRVVALKITHPELSEDVEFVRRFISEARATARLNHPNVVAIYDQGSDAGVHYLAMEYVPGKTLRTLLAERGRLPPREALDIMTGVLAGLAAAHNAGIAHRDVKPENVLLTAAGQVKVADFGLARAVSGAVQTKDGMLIGTAAYLAPEQVSGGISDARTDVYAAGVMFYELLTGLQPHTGDTPLAVAQRHVSTPVPAPSIIVPRLPPALDALVGLATGRDPELRPADAGEFLEAVQDVRDGLPIVLRSRMPSHASGSAAAVAVQAADSRLPGSTGLPGTAGPTGSTGLSGAAGLTGPSGGSSSLTAADWRTAGNEWPGTSAGPGLLAPAAAASPFTRQDGDPVLASGPADTAYPPGNQTMVVAPDEQELYRGAAGGYGSRQHRRSRHGPRPPLLTGRRLALLAAGLAAVVTLALLSWWLTSGRYELVPQVRAMTLSTATADLKLAGFSPRTGPSEHSNLPRGEIVASRPSARSRVPQGSTVTLIVSLGPTLVPVPNVTGLALAAAEQALRKAGLTPGSVTLQASGISTGTVISTMPVAGTHWARNKPVQITVSAGPPLPDFVGQQVAVATAAAAAGNYQIDQRAETKSTDPAGTIISQSPKPGSPVTPGEVVIVYVSAGPQLVPIPDVHGLPLHEAERQLQAAGFQVAVNRTGFGDVVSDTSPSGQAPKGSVVTINVGGFFGL